MEVLPSTLVIEWPSYSYCGKTFGGFRVPYQCQEVNYNIVPPTEIARAIDMQKSNKEEHFYFYQTPRRLGSNTYKSTKIKKSREYR